MKISAHQTKIEPAPMQQYARCMTFFSPHASNDAQMRTQKRERTVPIPESIISVPGYPEKLAIFRIQASKFWQVRCWHNGKTFRKTTKSQSKRSALIFARIFYEQLMAAGAAPDVNLFARTEYAATTGNSRTTFGALAARMYANEQAEAVS